MEAYGGWMSKRDPELVLGFERIYERIGVPAMVVQIATGLWLAWRLRPELATWAQWGDPIALTICPPVNTISRSLLAGAGPTTRTPKTESHRAVRKAWAAA